jgi:hypothetical protein
MMAKRPSKTAPGAGGLEAEFAPFRVVSLAPNLTSEQCDAMIVRG